MVFSSRSAARTRGVSRSSRTLGAGCDGRRISGALLGATNDVFADGEVVWFWRPKAGAKLANLSQATETTTPGLREERGGNR